MSSQWADTLNVPANMNAALNLLHFFSGVKPTQGKFSSKEEAPLNICKLCLYVLTFWYLSCFLMISSEKYGSDKSTLPRSIANFIYGSKTRNSNLWRHLLHVHTEEYDKAVVQHKWAYKLSTESRNVSTQIACNQCSWEVPLFSPAVFLEHLTCFVVADDQVSPDGLVFFHTLTNLQSIRVVECPEFWQLCMVLRKTLVDIDIPCCDKMREAIISQWQDSFGQLKLDLSVGRCIFSFCCINCLRS